MLRSCVTWNSLSRCRPYSTSHGTRHVVELPDASVETFRRLAFELATPAMFPRQCFANMPAVRKWFVRSTAEPTASLNVSYLARYGAAIVPLEVTNDDKFARIEQSLSFFLECVKASTSTFVTSPRRYFSSHTPGARAVKRKTASNNFFSSTTLAPPTTQIYLAQAPICDLPPPLAKDVPTPEIVLQAGKGDIYDSSIWLGYAPTYTPLHRDPNPNLFVQLAGKKVVRLFRPQVGHAIFAKVQEKIGGQASANLRGEEMMQGTEKKALETEVWGTSETSVDHCFEAVLDSGDGLFIPRGWWHSIKGFGPGMTGSVNWWFR